MQRSEPLLLGKQQRWLRLTTHDSRTASQTWKLRPLTERGRG